ncbi:gliding motility-associated C-terminal domain-containing protein [Bacteroidales bacterium AH-315-N07]|nr:gliding motility-associated C-terminal domain-containing protein [Bacteroidales bacterium AH-315-N07]
MELSNKYCPKVCFFLLTIVFLFPVISLFGSTLNTNYSDSNLKFIENKSQWNKNILFQTNLYGGKLFLEKTAFTYAFYDVDKLKEVHDKHAHSVKEESYAKNDVLRCHAFQARFLNANPNVSINGNKSIKEFRNYYIGNDVSRWASKVKIFKIVQYHELFTDIDLQVYSLNNSLKYDFVVKPGGNVSSIAIKYEGLDNIFINNSDENLHIITSINELIEQKPFAYQIIDGIKSVIPCKFTLKDDIVGFEFPEGFDNNHPLIIDPKIIFASYSGSTADNWGSTATYDADYNFYAGGIAFDFGYPTTTGAYQIDFEGGSLPLPTDIVISKYDSLGKTMIYSTYLGGLDNEFPHSLIVNDRNQLLVLGSTSSLDFPTTNGAFDRTFNGGTNIIINSLNFTDGTDITISKFSDDGANLLASTLIGGDDNDGINTSTTLKYNYGDEFRGEIRVDENYNIYVVSCTYSTNFPVTTGVFQNTNAGGQDGVVMVFNSDLTSLKWSSYLGGSGDDAAYAMFLDTLNNIYVSGGTSSTTFTTTTGALNETYLGGSADGFITKIGNDGQSILISTFLGTGGYDQAYFIQLDKNQKVYAYGQTEGLFLVTSGVYSNLSSGQFITKLDNDLDSVYYSTVFGNGDGDPDISPSAFLVDVCEGVYASGWARGLRTGIPTTGMPITPDAVQPTTTGFDFYLLVLARDAVNLVYGTYYGGDFSREHVDGGTSRFDKRGVIYQSVCAGCGGNSDFPTTSGVVSNLNNSPNCNNGTLKIDFDLDLAVAQFTPDKYEGCAPLTVNFNNRSSDAEFFMWDFGGGDTTSIEFEPVRIYTTPGKYSVRLSIVDSSSCNFTDTVYKVDVITVHPSTTLDAGNDVQICSGDTTTLNATGGGLISYLWTPSKGLSDTNKANPIAQPDSTTTYRLTAIDTNGCVYPDSVKISVFPSSIAVSPDINLCLGESTQLQVLNLDPADSLQITWTPSTGLSDTTIINPIATPTVTTLYQLQVSPIITDQGDTCSVIRYVTVNVSDGPITVKASDDTSICEQVLLKVSATGNAEYYQWSTSAFFTDTLNSDLKDTTFFISPSYGITTYYVKAVNDFCAALDIVNVNSNKIDVILNSTEYLCKNDSVQLNVVGQNAGQTLFYEWTPSTGLSNTTISNPIAKPDTTTIYNIKISTIKSGKSDTCSIFESITVEVSDNRLIANTIGDTSTCDDITLFSTTNGEATSYIWSTSDNFSDTLNLSVNDSSVLTTPPIGTTTYYIKVSNLYCDHIDSINIVSHRIGLTANADMNICYDDTISLNVSDLNTQDSTSYNWIPVNGIISGENTAGPLVNPNTTTTYYVTGTNQFGCRAEDTVIIFVSSQLLNVQAITDEDTITKGESTILHALNSLGFNILWKPSNSLNSATDIDPIASPDTSTTYYLTTVDTLGCISIDTVTITVIIPIICGERELFIPNAFTPDGDNINDILQVRGAEELESMFLIVYNRWGERVFQTDDRTIGWDGTFKGMEADPGVFVFYLEAKCPGEKKRFLKGNITLIR